MTRDSLCVGEDCLHRDETGERRRRTTDTGRLCPPCRKSVESDLGDLPGLYAACERILGGGSGQAETGQRRSNDRRGGMPFNTAAFELRSAISNVLCSWASLVVDERSVSPPARTVPAVADFLLRHLDWLAGHEAAGDFASETAELARRARRMTSSERVRKLPVGTCPEEGCAGTLEAAVRPGGPGGRSSVRCTVERAHRWSESEWLGLRARMASGQPGETHRPVWLGASEIARMWRVSPGSVYRMASEGSWRRRRRGKRTYYHVDDVTATLRGRGATALSE